MMQTQVDAKAKSKWEWIYETAIELVLAGWEPCVSGDGKFLYWSKEGSYNCPNVYQSLTGKAAIEIIFSTQFNEDVDKLKKALMAELMEMAIPWRS